MDIGDLKLSALSVSGSVDGDAQSLSPLQRLPTELKRQIIGYIILRGLTITFPLHLPLHEWSQRQPYNADKPERIK